jgi:hypothetical protein
MSSLPYRKSELLTVFKPPSSADTGLRALLRDDLLQCWCSFLSQSPSWSFLHFALHWVHCQMHLLVSGGLLGNGNGTHHDNHDSVNGINHNEEEEENEQTTYVRRLLCEVALQTRCSDSLARHRLQLALWQRLQSLHENINSNNNNNNNSSNNDSYSLVLELSDSEQRTLSSSVCSLLVLFTLFLLRQSQPSSPSPMTSQSVTETMTVQRQQRQRRRRRPVCISVEQVALLAHGVNELHALPCVRVDDAEAILQFMRSRGFVYVRRGGSETSSALVGEDWTRWSNDSKALVGRLLSIVLTASPTTASALTTTVNSSSSVTASRTTIATTVTPIAIPDATRQQRTRNHRRVQASSSDADIARRDRLFKRVFKTSWLEEEAPVEAISSSLQSLTESNEGLLASDEASAVEELGLVGVSATPQMTRSSLRQQMESSSKRHRLNVFHDLDNHINDTSTSTGYEIDSGNCYGYGYDDDNDFDNSLVRSVDEVERELALVLSDPSSSLAIDQHQQQHSSSWGDIEERLAMVLGTDNGRAIDPGNVHSGSGRSTSHITKTAKTAKTKTVKVANPVKKRMRGHPTAVVRVDSHFVDDVERELAAVLAAGNEASSHSSICQKECRAMNLDQWNPDEGSPEVAVDDHNNNDFDYAGDNNWVAATSAAPEAGKSLEDVERELAELFG